MEIVYCSTCGFRIKDADFAEGRAARVDDKPYCQKCRPAPPAAPRKSPGTGITGIPAQRASVVGHAPYHPAHSASHAGHGVHDSGLRTRDTAVRAEPKGNAVLIIGGAAAVLLIFGLILFSGGGSTPKTQAKTVEKVPPEKTEKSADPERVQANVPEPRPQPTNPRRPDRTEREPAPRLPPMLTEDTREAAARDAFNAIVNSTTEVDKLGRAAQWEDFLQRYGDTIIAARARGIHEALQREIASDKPPKSMVELPGPGTLAPTPDINNAGGGDAPKTASQPPGPTPAPAPLAQNLARMEMFEARVAYAAYQDEVLALARKLNGVAVNQRVSKAEGEAALKPLSAEVAADKKIAAMVADFEAAVLRGAAKLKDEDDVELRLNKGAPIRVGKKAPFQVVDMKETTLNLTSRGMTMPVTLESLQVDSRKRLAMLDIGFDGPSYMRRIFMEILDSGPRPMGQARAYLEKAKNNNVAADDIAIALRWIEACEEEVRERSAKAAFGEIAKMADDQNYRILETGLKRFNELFAKTAFATKKSAELKKYHALTHLPGLLGRYFNYKGNGGDFMNIAAEARADFARADAQINFASVAGDWYNSGLSTLQVAWTGFIQIDKAGSYQFFLESDDGSRLFINGKQIVDNGGGHGMEEKSGTLDLAEGRHELKIDYFNSGGPGGCILRWLPPGGAKEVVPAKLLFHPRPE
ncbi:MAG TPA: PA14 domain-containing protein [Planctomycetota bacterium]|nr:PA14 domain-containing protein [Planctomycetota bacterium]